MLSHQPFVFGALFRGDIFGILHRRDMYTTGSVVLYITYSSSGSVDYDDQLLESKSRSFDQDIPQRSESDDYFKTYIVMLLI